MAPPVGDAGTGLGGLVYCAIVSAVPPAGAGGITKLPEQNGQATVCPARVPSFLTIPPQLGHVAWLIPVTHLAAGSVLRSKKRAARRGPQLTDNAKA